MPALSLFGVDGAERRLGADDREQDVRVGVGEVVVAADAAAEHEVAVALDVVGEADAGRDVVLVLGRALAEVLEADAGAGQPAALEDAGLRRRPASSEKMMFLSWSKAKPVTRS